MDMEMDKQFAKAGQGGYGRNRETFARAFECYMVDKLWEEGNENQYLTVFSGEEHLLRTSGRQGYAVLEGNERKQINERFGTMILELKELGVLCDRSQGRAATGLGSELGDKMDGKMYEKEIGRVVDRKHKKICRGV